MESNAAQAEQAPRFSRQYRIAGYIGVFLLSFTLFLVLTFPYDLLTQGIMNRFKSRIPFPVKVEKVFPSLPLGLKMDNVTLGPFLENNPATITAETLTVKASLLKALSKKIDATLNGKLYGGSISGNVKGSAIGGNTSFQVTSLALQPLLTLTPIPLQISGNISGNGNFQWSKAKPAENTGEIHLTSPKIDMPNFDLKITRADFHFNKVEADIALEKGGILKIKTLNLEGEPCGFEITGTITLQPGAFENSQVDLEIVFHPTPEFESQVPVAILKKDDRGFYSGRLGGTFSRPSFP